MSGTFSLPLLFSHEEVGELTSESKTANRRALTHIEADIYTGKLTDLHSRTALDWMKIDSINLRDEVHQPHAQAISGFIPVAPVGTAEYNPSDYASVRTPTLIIYG